MPDHALLLQLMDIFHERTVQKLLPFLLGIHIMDHTQIDIVSTQPLQQILEGLLHLGKLTATHILTVLPRGTQMPLYVPFLSGALDALSDMRSYARLAHPAVQNIDPLFLAGFYHRSDAIQIHPLQPFPSEPDLTYHQSRLSKPSVLHNTPPSIVFG